MNTANRVAAQEQQPDCLDRRVANADAFPDDVIGARSVAC
jgi:hypothetical protein